MSIFDKLRFINETISVNGQPLNDDDTVEEVSPDYTGDNPEDEPSKDPNRDAPPKTPDPPAPAEDTPPTDKKEEMKHLLLLKMIHLLKVKKMMLLITPLILQKVMEMKKLLMLENL